MTRTIRRLLIGRWRLIVLVLRRFAPPLADPHHPPLLLMARWMRLRVAGRLVRLVVSVAVSVGDARMAAVSPQTVQRVALPRRLSVLVALQPWVAHLLLPRPVVGFRVRARQVLAMALLFPCCRV